MLLKKREPLKLKKKSKSPEKEQSITGDMFEIVRKKEDGKVHDYLGKTRLEGGESIDLMYHGKARRFRVCIFHCDEGDKTYVIRFHEKGKLFESDGTRYDRIDIVGRMARLI